MPIGDSIQRIPLLRPVLSFVLGVAVGGTYYDVLLPYLLMVGVGCLVACVVFAVLYLLKRSLPHYLIGVWAMCLFFVLGVTYSAQYIKRNGYEWSQAESIYKARVIDFPRERAHSTLCGLQVSAMKDSLGWREVNRKVFAYMEPSLSVQS